ARVEDQPGARRPGASRHAAGGAARGGACRRQGGRRRLRRGRSPARARRHGVRSRGQRDPRMARLAGSDVERRRRSDRRASARTRDAAVTLPARQAEDVAAAAQLACLLEASAPKPGNVSPFASFRDATYEDFLASAAAIGPALLMAGERSLGATIRAGVEATARWAPSNTNLGLVLLLAPLARAALRPGDKPLRAQVTATLAATTVADARDAYAAIRSAAPGGLGRASEQDVSAMASRRVAVGVPATLREAMAGWGDGDAVASPSAIAPAEPGWPGGARRGRGRPRSGGRARRRRHTDGDPARGHGAGARPRCDRSRVRDRFRDDIRDRHPGAPPRAVRRARLAGGGGRGLSGALGGVSRHAHRPQARYRCGSEGTAQRPRGAQCRRDPDDGGTGCHRRARS